VTSIAEAPAAPRPATSRLFNWFDPASLLLALMLALPAVLALVSALRRPFLPVSDWALIESNVRAVGTSHTPLIGAYSRFGWAHPGPWPFYLLAGPYWLFGAAHGILAAAAVWNLLTLLALGLVLRRLDHLLAVCALPVLAVLVLGLGAGFLSDPWNPSLPVLTVALLVPVAWAHGRGARWALPVLAALASVAVQAHLGFLPVVASVVAYSLVMRALGDRRAGRSPLKPLRPLVVTAVVLFAAWLPPAIDQVVHTPGNLSTLADHLVHPPPPVTVEEKGVVGWAHAGSLFARQFGVPGPLFGSTDRRLPMSADRTAGNGHPLDIAPLVLTLIGAVVVAARRRDTEALSLLGLAFAAMAGCYVGLAVIRGEPFEWLVKWSRSVAAWTWIAALWVVARALVSRVPRRSQLQVVHRLAPVIAVVVGLAGFVTIFNTTLGQRPNQRRAELAARLAPRVLAATRQYHGVYLFLAPGTLPQETNGLLLAFQRAGRTASTSSATATAKRYQVVVSLTGDEEVMRNARWGAFGLQLIVTTTTGLTGPGDPRLVAAVMQPFLPVKPG